MFGFFGLGTQEILLLALLGGVVAVVAIVIVSLNKRSSSQSPDRIAELEEENRRLREQVNERRDAKD